MPTTFLFGGQGRTGRCLTRILTKETAPPHKVYTVTRSATHAPSLTDLGATPIVLSLVDATVSELADTIRQCAPDYIVWAAGADGADPGSTDSVDRWGAIKSMDAAAAAGVERYILISSADVRDRENRPVPAWYNEADVNMSGRVWGAVEPFMRAKFDADKELRVGNGRRGLKYTIVRPGGLIPSEGTGTVVAGKVHIGMISREDVARVVAHCMQDAGTIGLAFDVCGGDLPIDEAVAKVVKEGADTFEGYY